MGARDYFVSARTTLKNKIRAFSFLPQNDSHDALIKVYCNHLYKYSQSLPYHSPHRFDILSDLRVCHSENSREGFANDKSHQPTQVTTAIKTLTQLAAVDLEMILDHSLLRLLLLACRSRAISLVPVHAALLGHFHVRRTVGTGHVPGFAVDAHHLVRHLHIA